MSFLYRFAITITHKQPYVDWANSFNDGGPELTVGFADDQRTIYLVPESDQRPSAAELLDEFWEDIFEEEVAAWMQQEEDWPTPRTREMFDNWFAAEVSDHVFDLTPDEPLTHAEVEALGVEVALRRCAWCDLDIDEGAGRFVGFKLPDRDRFAHREGLTLPLAIDDEQVVVGILSPADSDLSRAADDVVFRACTSRCEKALRKAVPKALRKVSN
jgi:hypothetical protein